MAKSTAISGSLTGSGVAGVPSPTEKSKPNPGGKITGTGKGGAITSANPLTASHDSRPLPGDNKMGATRAKGTGPSGGGKGASGRVKNLH